MDKKIFELSLLLSKKEIYISELASIYKVSERTVRNDLSKIENFFNQYRSNSIEINDGLVKFNLSKREVIDICNNLSYYDYSLDSVERVIVIIVYGLLNNKFFTISELSKFMEVSRSTINNDLNRVRAFIDGYSYNLTSEASKGIKLEEISSKYRNDLIFDLISFDLNNIIRFFNQDIQIDINNIGEEKLSEYIEEIEIIIKNLEKKTGWIFTRKSSLVFTYYLAMYLPLINNDNEYENLNYKSSLTKELIISLKEKFNIKFLETDVIQIERLLNTLNFEVKEYDKEDLINIQFVTRKFIEEVSSKLNINLNLDDDLLNNLSKHLSSILTEEINKINEFDHINQIAEKYKEITNIINDSVHILEDFADRKLNNTEINFIVIYIIGSIEKLINEIDNVIVLIVCEEGIATSYLLKEKIRRYVPGINEVVANKHNMEEKIEKYDPDIIVSTVKLESELDYIYINDITKLDEINLINEKVNEIKLEKLKNNNVIETIGTKINLGEGNNQKRLSDFLIEAHINMNVSVENWRDSIKESSKVLLEEGYIEDIYVENMIKNIEKYGPYVVISEGVAIPHAGSNDGVIKTGMSLIKLDEAISFGDSKDGLKVNYVISLSSINNEHFSAFFDLVNGLQNQRLKEKFMNAEDSKELRRVLFEMEELNNR